MFEAISHGTLVSDTHDFTIAGAATAPPSDEEQKTKKKRLKKSIAELSELQRQLYAQDSHSLLLVFQAMDAAGKDSTIRAVLSGVNPAGCQVFSFKQPSAQELDHDFLWRTSRCLPERGRIGVFNRSYYEEVLVVRVHPEYLTNQRLPEYGDLEELWRRRFASIRDQELHLAQNGTVVLKFFLNVSREEQARRFVDRLKKPEKHWKFSASDITERALWDDYMHCYEAALRETSKPWAPWYAIPADDKPYMRATVAEIVVDSLKQIKPSYPSVAADSKRDFKSLREKLENGEL